MQTRKRAKSAVFGKKVKEKEEVKETVKYAEPVLDAEKIAEKAEVVERRTVPDKPQSDELSETPPKETPAAEAAEVATPPSEFITENPLSATPETSAPADSKNEPEAAAEPEKTSAEPAEIASQPIEPAELPSSEQPPQAAASEELSPTLPQSAFTIQSNEVPMSAPKEGKSHFWLYFIVVAFVSFILGLTAMAGASYMGLVKVSSVPKLPSIIQLPALPGTKPTATPIPSPTAAPTQKPVDLQAYTISVLNGSGIAGKAGSVKSTLTTAGFKVSSVGNADKSTYIKTEIATKKSVDPAYLSKLEDELKKSFAIDTTVTTLSASSTTDVIVTIGTQTAQ